MKINRNIFICALLVLMLLCCVNAVSAEESLNEPLATDAVDEVVVADAPVEELSASGDTYVVDANGGGDYTSISAAVSAASGGETIFIKNGEYTETSKIDIGTKSLTFTGESQEGVIIKSGDNDLFYTTGSEGASLVISGLTFKDISMTGARVPIFIGGNDNVEITDCTFDNCASRYGALRIFTSGTVTVDNCKFLGTKSSTGSYSSAIDFGGSGAADYTLKNSIIDGSEISSANTASYIFGAIYSEKTAGLVTLDNVTISNCNLTSASGIITAKGNMNIKDSRIVNNYVYRDLAIAGLFFVNGAKDLTIETSVIANNSQPNHILSANSASATYNLNYNNIQNNSFNTAFANPDYATYTLDYNYWGSNDAPAGVTVNDYAIYENGEFKLNSGAAMEKEIPDLNSAAAGPDYIYVSPDGDDDSDGSTKDAPTTLEHALKIAPEGGSIFLCNGEYDIEALFISQSVNLIGESREDVILTTSGGAFVIGNPQDPVTPGYSVDYVSLSKMTIESDASDFIFVPADMIELNITDCVITSTGFVKVGYNVLGDHLSDSTGTLNFKKNIIISDDEVIGVTGQWNANINDNIFLNSNSGENTVINEDGEGTIDVDYNYWGSNTPATDLDVSNYIIVDVKANASEIYTDESAKITIKTTLDDGETNAVSHLPDYPIEATLSAGGSLSQRELALVNGAGSVVYSSDVARNDNIAVEILGQTLTVPIKVKERYLGPIYVDTTGSDDNEGSENAPVATVAKAVELALVNGGSGEVIINEGTYVGNGFHVTDDLTVTGNGKVTLDANNEGRFFYMNYGDAANKIELHNLVLTNANGFGAAVYSFANELILDNVTIVNNQASNQLISSKGKLTIKDSEISNSMSGDVIQQTGNGDILINNTVFKDNSIMDSTSVMAVINLNSNSGNLVIENSKFINNTARQGVIKGNYNYNIDVKGTEFIDNTNAASYGGAIYTTGGTLDITDCVFVNNKAARSGGAIYVGYRSTATVDKSIFVNNVANTMDDDYYGDAIYNGNKLTVNNSVLLTNADNFLIYNDGEDNVVNAQNNWWGTNDDPSSLNGFGYYEDDDWEEYDCPPVDVSNWVTMNATFTPSDAQAGDDVTVTATFSNANLPDGINVTFTSTSGNLNTVVSTVDAQASTTYTIDANDEAIVATSTNAVVEMPIVADPFATNIVTQDNFYNFFDEYGNLLDTVPFDELIFQGEFSDLASHITINRALTITGDNAVLNDIGFIIAGAGVTLDNMTLVANSDLGNLINITDENAVIKNMDITYVVSEAASAINVCPGANGAQILNNNIYFESTVDDYAADEVTTAICVNSGVSVFDDEDPIEGLIIDGNNITVVIPAFLADVYENEYYVMGLSAVNGVRINGAEEFEFKNNKLDVTTNRLARTTPTIQALYVASSSGLIDGNNISMIDTFTPAGKDVYLYAVELINDEELTISNNNFNLSTTGGKEEAGSAYAIIAIASEFEVTDNNITTVSNGPNIGIYFPSHMGSPCDAVISGNFINVTGLATAAHDTGLVSGIEIQTGDVEITDNTIYTYNIGEYAEDNYLYGISYAQDGLSPEVVITDNTIYTEGHYAISFLEVDDAEITDNYLVSTDLYGDSAVFIGEGVYNVENNLPTNVVTNDTFYNFFDENGILLDTIPFDELIFQGDFSNLTDVIVFNRPIVATGENAVLDNIAIRIAANEVNLNGFTLNANKEFANNNGALIYATGSDIEISDVVANYVAPSEAEAIAIYANAAENFVLFNSEIIYESTNPGSNHNYGLEVRDSNCALVDNVTISAILPSVPVKWGGEGISQDLVLAVGIQGGDEVEFTNNRVTVTTNGGIGDYPTVDAVMVYGANDILIKGNNITHVDTTTEDSARYYYSLDIYGTTGTVEENNIIMNTTAGVDRAGTAYPIQLNGPSTLTVKNNNLTAVSKGPIAGIYATNWMGPITLIAENNNIDVTGYATTGNYALVAGIEAEIDVLKAYNNTIVVNNAVDYDDVNQVYGISMVSLYMSGEASADIKDNNITVDGKYAVYYVNAVNTNVTGNTLYGHELEGDAAAVIESGENNVIENNYPAATIITPVLSADDLEMSFKDGSAWTVTLTDGTNPIEGAVVKVGILGKTYSLTTDADGTVSLPVNVAPGTYDVNATFEGDEIYESAFVNATVTVGKAVSILTAEDVTLAYKNGSWIVTLTGAEGVIPKAAIKFGILGKVYTLKTDENGVAALAINLAPGTYSVNATFDGNYKHEAAFVEATVTVEKSTLNIASEDLTMCYKDGSAYAVTVTDADGAAVAGTTVKFTFGTTTYNIKTDENGIASLPINVNIGEYTVKAVVDDAKYTSEEATNTVTVTDYEAVLVANDINMTYQDGTNYEVQLTTADGNPIAVANLVVKITLLGKTYSIKTDAEGIAKLPINLKAGTYEFTAEYNGSQVNSTVVVNKA